MICSYDTVPTKLFTRRSVNKYGGTPTALGTKTKPWKDLVPGARAYNHHIILSLLTRSMLLKRETRYQHALSLKQPSDVHGYSYASQSLEILLVDAPGVEVQPVQQR